MKLITAMFALIRKDIILFLHDRRALLLTLLMPVVLAAFFGYLMGGGQRENAAKIEVALVLEDDHAISQKIAKGLESEGSLRVEKMPLDAARERVRKGKISAAIVIPKGFGEASGKAFFSGSAKPEISLLYDPSQTAVLAMVKGMLTQQVMQAVSSEMMNGKGGEQFVDDSLKNLDAIALKNTEQAELSQFLKDLKQLQSHQKSSASASVPEGRSGGLSMPFQTKDEAVVAKDSLASQYNGYAHSFAGMAVQFILFMAIDVGISVLLARRLGLWNRLLAAPISVGNLITARGLSCALIAATVITVIYALATILFKVQILGSMIGFAGIVISFSLMAASFGLFIAAFGKTPEAARGIAIFATMIMVMLGGAWMPSFMFPQWLQKFTILIPTRWAVDGFEAMTWRGLGFDAALPSMAALMGFTLLFGGLAVWRFRREMQ